MSYIKNQATANRLLTKFGQSITLTSNTAGAYNVATGTSAITQTTQSAIGAIFDWGTENRPSYGQEFIDSSLIRSQDRQLLLSPVGINQPNLGDIATIQGKQYNLVPPMKSIAPAGICVLIICNIRGI